MNCEIRYTSSLWCKLNFSRNCSND